MTDGEPTAANHANDIVPRTSNPHHQLLKVDSYDSESDDYVLRAICLTGPSDRLGPWQGRACVIQGAEAEWSRPYGRATQSLKFPPRVPVRLISGA